MKKLIAALLCTVLLLSAALSACASVPDDEAGAAEDGFKFNPKLESAFAREIYGDKFIETWYNLVDAALAGEDTFACPDQDTYDWVFYQFPDRYFPVLTELLEYSYEPVENGVAHLEKKTDHDRAARSWSLRTARSVR